jgi:hypothetical protein
MTEKTRVGGPGGSTIFRQRSIHQGPRRANQSGTCLPRTSAQTAPEFSTASRVVLRPWEAQTNLPLLAAAANEKNLCGKGSGCTLFKASLPTILFSRRWMETEHVIVVNLSWLQLRASPIVWGNTSSKLMNLNKKRVQQLALNIVQWENNVLRIERAYIFSPI